MIVFRSNSPYSLRIIFMGSPSFVVPVLERLVESSLIEAALVVTQPDKPNPTPVKKKALELRLEVYAPTTLKQDNRITSYQPDLIIVSAYGKLIPKEILSLPKYGCLNIHPSLLPKYRGPSPGQAAILAGEKASGVSVMLVDEGFDTGPILAQKEIPLEGETAESFYDKAFKEGVELLLEVLPCYVEKEILRSADSSTSEVESADTSEVFPRLAQNDDGKSQIFIPPKPQDHSKATYSEKFTRESGRIDWGKSDIEIERMIRAFYAWPGTWTTVGEIRDWGLGIRDQGKENRRVKILKAHLDENKGLVIDKLQIEGKKPISWKEFERGYLESQKLKVLRRRLFLWSERTFVEGR